MPKCCWKRARNFAWALLSAINLVSSSWPPCCQSGKNWFSFLEEVAKAGLKGEVVEVELGHFKENKGNLQKFINYVTALDKKVQFVFKKENTVIRNCWTAGTLLEFIMEKESIKTRELPDKLHKTYQELCRQLKSLKENKGTISTLIEWSSALGYTVTVELI